MHLHLHRRLTLPKETGRHRSPSNLIGHGEHISDCVIYRPWLGLQVEYLPLVVSPH